MKRYGANITEGSQVRAVTADPERDEYYRSLLPPEIVQWSLLEPPQPFTFESLYTVYKQHGPKTLELLKGAMAVDCQQVMEAQGLKGVHPQSFKSLFGQE